MEVKKQHRSKYNFGSCKVGDEILVDPLDVHSMLCSLKSFNKRHDRDIEVEPTGELSWEGKMICKVTNI